MRKHPRQPPPLCPGTRQNISHAGVQASQHTFPRQTRELANRVDPGRRGYGHTFPEANTTWEADVKGSASHQRLIRYNVAGLDMVVRFEADGYIWPHSNPKQLRHIEPITPKTDTPSLDALAASLSTTTVSRLPAVPPDPPHVRLTTI